MNLSEYPLLSKSEVETPPAGFQKLFRDKDNGGKLTAKESDCTFNVVQFSTVSDETAALMHDLVCKIIDDAGCALKDGLIDAEAYESIVDNFNLCLVVDVDPVTGSHQVCIQNEETLFISLVPTHVLCNGESNGTATPTITGGEAPYNLDWDGADPANLAAGSYTLTVTDNNGKTKLVSFIITEPPVLTATGETTDDTGGGNGTATANPTGGTPPYTYLWDDGGAQTTQTATGLSAGDYNCVITDDNGCTFDLGPLTVN